VVGATLRGKLEAGAEVGAEGEWEMEVEAEVGGVPLTVTFWDVGSEWLDQRNIGRE